MDEVNKMAELGTQLAHVDGGVPNMRLSVPVLEVSPYYLGQIILFLRESLRHQRQPLGGKYLQPAGRGSLQEEHVRPAEQTGLRKGK